MPPRSTPSLGRSVKGLPRYFMDCGWYRHPRFVGLAPDVLFVFEALVGYSTEHATDGRCPGHHEDLAAALGMRSSVVRKAIKPLVDREVLRRDGDELVVRNWADHNPTAAEVEAYNEARSKSGSLGNHKRWHESRGVTDPECEHCKSESVTDRKSDRKGDPETSQAGSHGMGWDGSSSSSPPQRPIAPRPTVAGAEAPTEEDRPPDPETTAEAAIAHMARCDLERAKAEGTPIRSKPAYLAKLTETRRDDHGAELLARARNQPGVDPVDLAEQLDPACGPLDGGTARANARWAQTQADTEEDRPAKAQAMADQENSHRILELLTVEQLRAIEADARAELADGSPDALIRRHVRTLALIRHADLLEDEAS